MNLAEKTDSDRNQEALARGLRHYVELIAKENGLFAGKGESGLLVTSIIKLLRYLNDYGYQATLLQVENLPGLVTEARFRVTDPGSPGQTPIETEVTLASEDRLDYQLLVQGLIR